MALLGSGRIGDLETLGIRVSKDLLLDMAQGSPAFGIDPSLRSFSFVGSDADVVAEVARASAIPASLVEKVVWHLVSVGRMGRAAAIAATIGSQRLVGTLLARYPVELIDSGHAGLLACGSAREQKVEGAAPRTRAEAGDGVSELLLTLLRLRGREAAAASDYEPEALRALVRGGDEARLRALLDGACERPATRLQLAILLGCEAIACRCSSRDVMRGGWLDRLCAVGEGCDDGLSRVLACHLRALGESLGGRALEAYRRLVVAREQRLPATVSSSVFSALLQRDFGAVKLLVGDRDGPGDADLCRRAEEVLARKAPASLRRFSELYGGLISAALRLRELGSRCDRAILQAERRGEATLVALASLVRAMEGLASRAYRNAHLHAGAARRASETSGTADVGVLATIVDLLAHEGLGERPPDVPRAGRRRADEEVGEDVRALLDVASSATRAPGRTDGELGAMVRGVDPRAEVLAFAGFITGLPLRSSVSLRGALPPCWLGPHAAEVGGESPPRADDAPRGALAAPPGNPGASGARAFGPGSPAPCAQRLEVRVLGGLSVRLDGARLSECRWKRSQARTLLAMLALTPGHAISRGEAIERLWPESDFSRGKVSLYSVLSSLRMSLGQHDDASQFVVGEAGRIWLDGGLVRCDIDEFERMARAVASPASADDDTVSLCLRMEAMYGEGSHVPSRDASGMFRRRHEELARRYVNSMLSGSEAAMRMHDVRQAAWFAESASAVASKSEVLGESLARALKLRSGVALPSA